MVKNKIETFWETNYVSPQSEATTWEETVAGLTSSETIPLLGLIMDQIKEHVDYDVGAIMLLSSSYLKALIAQADTPRDTVSNWQLCFDTSRVYHEIVRRRRPLVIPDTLAEINPAQDFRQMVGEALDLLLPRGRSWMGIPLVIKEKCVGMLSLFHRRPHHYTLYHAALAQPFVSQIVSLMEHHQLYQQLYQQAILQERARLAREIHDQLAQSLACINLKSALVSDLLAADQVDEAQARTQELKQLIQDSYSHVREEIFNLRSSFSPSEKFLTTLQNYLAEYEKQHPLSIHLLLSDRSLADFSPVITVQLIRIIQEALTNVHKHAEATQVTISFDRADDMIHLCLRDDGQGFDLNENREDSFGLSIMQERAESIGARLEIYSEPGQGTQITLWLPVC